jgi:hypothetical protein
MRYAETGGSIEVHPADANGFTVGLCESAGEIVVSFEGWHEHFKAESEALNCFAFGLSESCRLRVAYRGAMPVSWAVECWRDERWIPDTETGLIFVPFWRSKSVRYLQNRWLPAA